MNKDQKKFQSLLKKNFLELQQKNPSYTLRSYARKLGIASGPLSELMQGKRKISLKMAKRLIPQLKVSFEEYRDLMALFQKEGDLPKFQSKLLTEEELTLISDWEHLAIISLLNMKNFRSDIHWISDRLQISPAKVAEALERLEKSNLIKKDKQTGEYIFLSHLKSTDDIPSQTVKKIHRDDLELIKKSLNETPVSDRYFSTVTLKFNLKYMLEVKRMIYEFEDKITAFVADDDANEVYKMSVYLFPLTKVHSNK